MRDLVLLIAIVIVAGVAIGGMFYVNMPKSVVYACHDKEMNPPEIQKMCQRLTKHQWWGAYYTGKQP